MFCAKCGSQIADGAKFCPVCGNVIEMEPKSAAPQDVQPAAPVYDGVYQTPVEPVAGPAPEGGNRVEDDEAEFTAQQRKILIRTMALISYLGAYLFFPMFVFKDKPWLRAHVNNGLVLLIFSAGFTTILIIPILGWIVGFAGLIFCMVLQIMGIVKSIQGNEFQMPWFFGMIHILK